MKSSFANSFIENNFPVANLLKIGLLLMLCFSSFMLKFHYHKKSMKYSTSKAAIEYDETQNANESLEKNKQYINDEKLPKIEEIDFFIYK